LNSKMRRAIFVAMRIATKRIIAAVSVLSVIFIFMSAGGAEPELKTEPDGKLPFTRWELVLLNGSPVIPGTDISLEFNRKTLYGNAGCNSYSGEYSANMKGTLKVDNLVNTSMACFEPDGILEQESEYLGLLNRSDEYVFSADRLILSVSSVKGNPTLGFEFVRPPEDSVLTGRWKVITFATADFAMSPVAGTESYVTFGDGTFETETASGNLQGTYTVKNEKVSFNADFNDLILSGVESVTDQERLFYSIIADARSLTIKGNRLFIETKTGEELDLEKL
jgi:heat shock protein HslJ